MAYSKLQPYLYREKQGVEYRYTCQNHTLALAGSAYTGDGMAITGPTKDGAFPSLCVTYGSAWCRSLMHMQVDLIQTDRGSDTDGSRG